MVFSGDRKAFSLEDTLNDIGHSATRRAPRRQPTAKLEGGDFQAVGATYILGKCRIVAPASHARSSLNVFLRPSRNVSWPWGKNRVVFFLCVRPGLPQGRHAVSAETRLLEHTYRGVPSAHGEDNRRSYVAHCRPRSLPGRTHYLPVVHVAYLGARLSTCAPRISTSGTAEGAPRVR